MGISIAKIFSRDELPDDETNDGNFAKFLALAEKAKSEVDGEYPNPDIRGIIESYFKD